MAPPEKLHPEMRAARFIPRIPITSKFWRVLPQGAPKVGPVPDDLVIDDVEAPGLDGNPPVKLRIYRPKNLKPGSPGMFWMNGGGFVGGTLEQDDRTNREFARQLGITVVAVRYRVAPEHPSPAALDDAYAGLLWMSRSAKERGIDPTRIAIAGASAGGGLAAALVLRAHDLGEVTVAFQLLVYPMLDDRTVIRTDHDTRGARVWQAQDNRYGWTSYLGVEPGSDGVSPYAAPARRENLSGLPPAWIGVGTLDVFHDEDVEYARRLTEAGVSCELVIVPGAFHGFDVLFRKKPVGKAFWHSKVNALRRGLSIPAQ
ncbi:MAG: alpha/beta hydrolase [Microbacteriaceae bacterium]|nr:alpha/beta hydrolase [Microbacteriaceae bacterium]